MQTTRLLITLSCVALAAFSHPATAAPGDLDLTFGGTGKVTTAIGSGDEFGAALAIQSDGKIVVAGTSYNGSNDDFAVVRYNANGSLDTSFGSTGKVTTAIGIGDDSGASVALQADGKVIVAGRSYNGNHNDFALVRYNANGSLDTTLNATGKVTTSIGIDAQGSCTTMQSDARILVAGFSYDGTKYNFALVRYNPNGSLDTSFNGTGTVTTGLGSYNDKAYSVAVQNDGKIVVAGSSDTYQNRYFALVRYNANGSLDTTLNGTGKVITAIGGNDDARSMAVQGDGKIVVAGSTHGDFTLVRYNTNGSLDAGFNGTGKVITDFNNSFDYCSSMALQSDGKIIVAGATQGSVFAVVRYNINGSLDTTFNGTGKVATAIGIDDFANSVAVQSDGKIVVAGTSNNGIGNFDIALVRYLGDTPNGNLSWPSQNGYAHPLSKTSSAIRSSTSAQFLSPEYETSAPPPRRHVGIDLVSVAGTHEGDPVYAIDDGEILYFRRQLDGDQVYPRGWYPVIFVRHHTAAGQAFWGIYGHCILQNSIYPRPANLLPADREEIVLDGSPISITKGKQIGTIIAAGEPHLHFGINTNANRSGFFTDEYGWGRVPLGTTDDYIYNPLHWHPPINQDSPNLLGFLNDPANSNNEPEQYSNWQAKSFAGTTVDLAQQAPNADADGDGILNRDEYALGLNPLSGTNEGSPKIELIKSGGFTFPGFKHQRRKNATDLIYTVCASDDLVNWDSSGTQVLPFGPPEACPDGDSELVTFRLSPYIPSALRKFFSVSISHAP